MNKKEKFERLQYETYKSIYLTSIVIVAALVVSNNHSGREYEFILSIFKILFGLVGLSQVSNF